MVDRSRVRARSDETKAREIENVLLFCLVHSSKDQDQILVCLEAG